MRPKRSVRAITQAKMAGVGTGAGDLRAILGRLSLQIAAAIDSAIHVEHAAEALRAAVQSESGLSRAKDRQLPFDFGKVRPGIANGTATECLVIDRSPPATPESHKGGKDPVRTETQIAARILELHDRLGGFIKE